MANLLAIESDSADGKILNIGSGKEISVNELSKMISDKEPVHEPSRKGDILHSYADITNSKVLGDYNKYSFDDGLKEIL